MKINLKNFKQHKSLDLEFPDTGLILIRGASGNGKSTIFDAIEDAFYGKGRDIKPWTGGNPSVSVEFNDICMERTRTPNTLKLSNNSLEYIDDAAQNEFERLIGMNYDEFSACSYIRSGFSNSLLTMQPANVMTFIQKLASNGVDPEKVKENIKVRIKHCSEEMRKTESEVAKYQAVIDSQVLPTLPSEPVDPKLGDIGSLRKEVDTTYKQLSKIESDRDNLNQLKTKHQSLNEAIKSAHEQLAALSEPESVEYDIDGNLKQKLIEKTDYLNKVSNLQALAKKVHDKYPEAAGLAKLSDFMQEKINSLKELLWSSRDDLHKSQSELDDIRKWEKETIQCPECDAHLKFSAGDLVSSGEHSDTDTTELELKIKTLRADISLSEEQVSFLSDITNKVSIIKSSLGTDPLPEYKDIALITQEIAKIDEQNAKRRELDTKKQQYTANKAILESSISNYSNDLANLTESISSIEENVLKYQEVKNKYDELKGYVEISDKYKSDLSLYNSIKSTYDNTKDIIKANQEKLEMEEVKYKEVSTRYGDLIKIKEKVDFAAAESMEIKVNEINENAKYYIDRMFEKDGTMIALTSTSKTQKGEDRAKIGLSVIHKGYELKNIKPFSQGEQSRAGLAFQLGLSELYDSPILMVDEGFTGLNPELQDECIEILKNAAQNKLILVIEHGASEHLFDQVVEI